MEIVEKETPINNEDGKKKAKYRISGNFSRFWKINKLNYHVFGG